MSARKLEGRLVVASHNQGKLWELRQLLSPHGVETVSVGELGLPEPEETEPTFAGNALLKAQAAATASGFPAFADDSGLCVEALDGAPGVYSARWGGPERDFGAAIGLVFAIEGLLLAGFTDTMRQRMAEISRLDPRRLRGVGLGAATLGVMIVWAARSFAG